MTSLPKLEANELRNVSEIIEHILCEYGQLAEESQVSFSSTTSSVIPTLSWRH